MQIVLRNSGNNNLSIEAIFEKGAGPQARNLRVRLTPGQTVDASVDPYFATLEEVNRDPDISALVASGDLTVSVVEDATDYASPSSQFNRLRADAGAALRSRPITISMPITSPVAAGTVKNNLAFPGRIIRIVSATIGFTTAPASAAGSVLGTLRSRTAAGGVVDMSATSIDLEALLANDDQGYALVLDAVYGNTLTVATDVLYLDIITDNADATAGAGGVLTVEYEVVDATLPYHNVNPDAITLITSADATDLPTLITLANELKADLNLHFASAGDTGAHATASAEVIAAADATDLATSQTLLNEAKANWDTHLSEAGVHFGTDNSNVVTSPDASDQGTSETLANELKSDFNLHTVSALDALPMGST